MTHLEIFGIIALLSGLLASAHLMIEAYVELIDKRAKAFEQFLKENLKNEN